MGHFILCRQTCTYCTFYYPVFNTRCRTGVHHPLPELCPQLKQVSSTFRSLSQQRGFPLGSGAWPGSSSECPLVGAETASRMQGWDGRGQLCPLTSPSPIPILSPAEAGQEGPPRAPDQKNPMNRDEKALGWNDPMKRPGGGQVPSWAVPALGLGLPGSSARDTGPSCGSNPLLPAPLTKKTPLLQFRWLSQTSEVRWYE